MGFLRGFLLGLLAALLCFFLLVFIFVLTVKSTLMNADFMVDESQKIDISVAVSEYLIDQMSIDDTIILAIKRSTVELEPWIRQQLDMAIYSCYDYCLGKTDSLELVLDLDMFKTGLSDNLEKVYSQFPPSDYLELPEADRESFLYKVKQDVMDILPSRLVITEIDLGDDIMESLDSMKSIASLITTSFRLSLVIMAVALLLLILILRSRKTLMRSFGIVLILDGLLTFSALMIFQNVYLSDLYPQDTIPELQVWIPLVIKDALYPAFVAGAVLLLLGIPAMAGSFLTGRK